MEILLKQLGGYLAMPIFVVDAGGDLVFYNEPAEALLGRRYEETGQMPLQTWGTMWSPTDDDGRPIPAEQVPLAVAVRDRRPAQQTFWITGLDGVRRRITVTALPLVADDDNLGAVAIFWEG